MKRYRSGALGFSIEYHTTESCVRDYVPRPMEYAWSADYQPFMSSQGKEPAAQCSLNLGRTQTANRHVLDFKNLLAHPHSTLSSSFRYKWFATRFCTDRTCKGHITRSVSQRCRLWVQENTSSCGRSALDSASTTAHIGSCKKLVMKARHALRVKVLEHWMAAYVSRHYPSTLKRQRLAAAHVHVTGSCAATCCVTSISCENGLACDHSLRSTAPPRRSSRSHRSLKSLALRSNLSVCHFAIRRPRASLSGDHFSISCAISLSFLPKVIRMARKVAIAILRAKDVDQ